MNGLKERLDGLTATGPYPCSALGMIGNTPMIELTRVSANPKVRIVGKLEGCNPGGSIKDRPSRQMIVDAIASGDLTEGKVVLEATSGNTGTGLAFVCRVLGIPLTLIVPRVTASAKLRDMRRLGARVKVVDGDTTEHALEVAYRLSDRHPGHYHMTDQYTNRSNPKAHYLTTGPEILEQCPLVTDILAAQGSFGTLGGISKYLSENRPDVRVRAVVARPGTTTIFGMKEADRAMPLVDDSALAGRMMVDGLSACEGIQMGMTFGYQFGPSAGAVLSAAVKLSGRLVPGSTIVCIFADFGIKYPGCPLYRPGVLSASSGLDLDHAAFTRW